MTPEGKIKTMVDLVLKTSADIWYFKPVQTGYGARALDYIGTHRGVFFAVETKAPGEKLTRFQKITAVNIVLAGGKVFIISHQDTVDVLRRWLER